MYKARHSNIQMEWVQEHIAARDVIIKYVKSKGSPRHDLVLVLHPLLFPL